MPYLQDPYIQPELTVPKYSEDIGANAIPKLVPVEKANVDFYSPAPNSAIRSTLLGVKPKPPETNIIGDLFNKSISEISKSNDVRYEAANKGINTSLERTLPYNINDLGGYRVGDNNEYRYGNAFSRTDNAIRVLGQFRQNFISTFLGSFVDVPILAGQLGEFGSNLTSKDLVSNAADSYRGLYDNNIVNALNDLTKDTNNENRTYETEYSAAHPYLSGKIFEHIVSGAGTAFGSMLGALSVDALVGVATEGIGVAPLLAMQLGKLGKTVYNFSKILNSTEEGYKAFKSTLKTADSINDAIQKTSNLTKVGDTFRKVHGFTNSLFESAIEAKGVQEGVEKSLKDKFREQNGYDASDVDLTEIRKTANDAGAVTLGLNMALLTATSRYELGDMLLEARIGKEAFERQVKGNVKLGVKGLDEAVDTLAGQVKKETKVGNFLKRVENNVIYKALNETGTLGRNSLGEMVEEGGQFGITTGVQDYYTLKYNKKGRTTTEDILDSALKGTGDIFTTEEGRLSMIAGLGIGILSGGSRRIYEVATGQKKREEPDAGKMAENVNSVKLSDIVSSRATVMSGINQVRNSQAVTGLLTNSLLGAMQKVKAIQFSWMQKARESGQMTNDFNLRKEQLNDARKLATNFEGSEKTFEDTFKMSANETNQKLILDELNTIEEDLTHFQAKAEQIDRVFVNPFNYGKEKDRGQYVMYENYKNELLYQQQLLHTNKKFTENTLKNIQDITQGIGAETLLNFGSKQGYKLVSDFNEQTLDYTTRAENKEDTKQEGLAAILDTLDRDINALQSLTTIKTKEDEKEEQRLVKLRKSIEKAYNEDTPDNSTKALMEFYNNLQSKLTGDNSKDINLNDAAYLYATIQQVSLAKASNERALELVNTLSAKKGFMSFKELETKAQTDTDKAELKNDINTSTVTDPTIVDSPVTPVSTPTNQATNTPVISNVPVVSNNLINQSVLDLVALGKDAFNKNIDKELKSKIIKQIADKLEARKSDNSIKLTPEELSVYSLLKTEIDAVNAPKPSTTITDTPETLLEKKLEKVLEEYELVKDDEIELGEWIGDLIKTNARLINQLVKDKLKNNLSANQTKFLGIIDNPTIQLGIDLYRNYYTKLNTQSKKSQEEKKIEADRLQNVTLENFNAPVEQEPIVDEPIVETDEINNNLNTTKYKKGEVYKSDYNGKLYLEIREITDSTITYLNSDTGELVTKTIKEFDELFTALKLEVSGKSFTDEEILFLHNKLTLDTIKFLTKGVKLYELNDEKKGYITVKVKNIDYSIPAIYFDILRIEVERLENIAEEQEEKLKNKNKVKTQDEFFQEWRSNHPFNAAKPKNENDNRTLVDILNQYNIKDSVEQDTTIDTRALLEKLIVSEQSSPDQIKLIRAILYLTETQDVLPQIEFLDNTSDKGSYFNKAENKIYIQPKDFTGQSNNKQAPFELVLVHEILHAVTVNSLQTNQEYRQKIESIHRIAYQEFEKKKQDFYSDQSKENSLRKNTDFQDFFIFDRLNQQTKSEDTILAEFLVESLTNPDLMRFLSGIQGSTKLVNQEKTSKEKVRKSMWVKLLDAINKLLGLNIKDDSLLAHLVDVYYEELVDSFYKEPIIKSIATPSQLLQFDINLAFSPNSVFGKLIAIKPYMETNLQELRNQGELKPDKILETGVFRVYSNNNPSRSTQSLLNEQGDMVSVYQFDKAIPSIYRRPQETIYELSINGKVVSHVASVDSFYFFDGKVLKPLVSISKEEYNEINKDNPESYENFIYSLNFYKKLTDELNKVKVKREDGTINPFMSVFDLNKIGVTIGYNIGSFSVSKTDNNALIAFQLYMPKNSQGISFPFIYTQFKARRGDKEIPPQIIFNEPNLLIKGTNLTYQETIEKWLAEPKQQLFLSSESKGRTQFTVLSTDWSDSSTYILVPVYAKPLTDRVTLLEELQNNFSIGNESFPLNSIFISSPKGQGLATDKSIIKLAIKNNKLVVNIEDLEGNVKEYFLTDNSFKESYNQMTLSDLVKLLKKVPELSYISQDNLRYSFDINSGKDLTDSISKFEVPLALGLNKPSLSVIPTPIVTDTISTLAEIVKMQEEGKIAEVINEVLPSQQKDIKLKSKQAKANSGRKGLGNIINKLSLPLLEEKYQEHKKICG